MQVIKRIEIAYFVFQIDNFKLGVLYMLFSFSGFFDPFIPRKEKTKLFCVSICGKCLQLQHLDLPPFRYSKQICLSLKAASKTLRYTKVVR